MQRSGSLCATLERLGRSHGIDLLRAIFALWVLIAHLVIWTRVTQGDGAVWKSLGAIFDALGTIFQRNGETHPAVIGFIVLSGYCIHRNGLRSDRAQTVPFIIRRCFRILPVFVAASALGLVLLYAHGSSLNGTPADVDLGCLLAKYSLVSAWVPTFYQCQEIDNGPLITVMVEIVLYALYVVFFWLFVWRGRERWIWVLCASSWFAALTSSLFSSSYPNQYSWFQNGSIFGFLPYWWLGVAFLNPKIAAAARRYSLPLLLAWCAMTVLTLYEPSVFVGEIRKLVFTCGIGLIICWLETTRVRRENPLSVIGRAGYSLYAYHGPLAGFLVLIGTPLWLAFIACVAFGLAGYHGVERPFMRLGRSLSRSRIDTVVSGNF
jgi:peptidoglycan/LPS O-acetylase OafA/YrhL